MKIIYTCDLCGMNFNKRLPMYNHIQIIHNRHKQCQNHLNKSVSKDGKRQKEQKVLKRCYQSDSCCNTFNLKTDVKRHYEYVHLKSNTYQCDLCDKSFSVKCNLTQHMESVHFKNKPHQCYLCDKCFSAKSNLKRHHASMH